MPLDLTSVHNSSLRAVALCQLRSHGTEFKRTRNCRGENNQGRRILQITLLSLVLSLWVGPARGRLPHDSQLSLNASGMIFA